MSVMTAANAPKLFAKSTKAINASRACVTALILALFGAGVSAQTLAPSPYLTVLDNNGRIINQACIWTYAAGTSTPIATYTDAALTTPNTNPIRSDASGRYVAYLTNGLAYKFVVENLPCSAISHGVVLKTVDNIASVPASNVNLDLTGTVGETVAAGDVVFLSDGSRGLTAGLWYRADADFADASVNASTIGMVPTAMTSASSGSIRLQGRITGLASLTPGGAYYVSATAGGVTVTAPALARFVGEADSTTTLVLAPNPARPVIDTGIVEGRLTGTTAVPVTTADVTGTATIYWTPFHGNRIALYDGAAWNLRTFSELTISVASCTASKPYDVFLYDTSGVVTAEQLVWTNDTTRATALTLQDGVLVKTGAVTRRYVGSYYCNSSGGQTDDADLKRNLSNYYHRKPRRLRVVDPTDFWTYGSATWQQARAQAANQVEAMIGRAEDPLVLRVVVMAASNNGGAIGIGIGEDGTAAPATGFLGGSLVIQAGGIRQWLHGSLTKVPAEGRHTYPWIEIGNAGATSTFYGDDGLPTASQGGLDGWIEG